METHRLNEEVVDQVLLDFRRRWLEQRVPGTDHPVVEKMQVIVSYLIDN